MRATSASTYWPLAVALLVVAGCASASTTLVGDAHFAALSPEHAVRVYSSERDVPEGFTVVAMLHFHDAGKWQSLDLADALPELKARARAAGADGLIIDSQHQVVSGIISRGIDVEARAVRLKASPHAK
jgi:hypothetical protein